MTLKLRPLSEAPRDGTPIVAVFPMNDEGDFLKTIFWTEGLGWDSTDSQTYAEDEMLGWVMGAEEMFTLITGEQP